MVPAVLHELVTWSTWSLPRRRGRCSVVVERHSWRWCKDWNESDSTKLIEPEEVKSARTPARPPALVLSWYVSTVSMEAMVPFVPPVIVAERSRTCW